MLELHIHIILEILLQSLDLQQIVLDIITSIMTLNYRQVLLQMLFLFVMVIQ